MSTAEFRQYLFPQGHPRIKDLKGLDAYAYRQEARKEGTFTGELIKGWKPLYLNDFHGVTEDGTLRKDLYPFAPALPGEEAPVAAMVEAAEALQAVVSAEDRDNLMYAVDAVEWQTWANPEFLQFDTGLRLEFQPQVVREIGRASCRG